MIDRFFIDSPISEGASLEIRDKEFHHLANVMRVKQGDAVELINGQGVLAKAVVKEIQKKQAILSVASTRQYKKHSQEIILAQAFTRPQKLDFIIEKGTELGVTQFWLFPGKKSGKKEIKPAQLERLKILCISALKQCGRLWLPSLIIKPELEKWTRLEAPFYFGDIRKSAPFLQAVFKPDAKTGFFVGPESGFEKSEIEKFEILGAVGVKLNPNILRTETAAMTAAGLIVHLMNK